MIKAIALYIISNITDILSTYYALSRNGIEGNPIAKILIQKGLIYSLTYKLIIITIILTIAIYLTKHNNKKISKILLYSISSLLLLVSFSNVLNGT